MKTYTDEEMHEESIARRKYMLFDVDEFEPDQYMGRPQPPLVKAAREDTLKITLPKDFDALDMEPDLTKILFRRRSHRVYTDAAMDLRTLSFLCFAQQGVKGARGKKYATLRTVPSGGARHAMELYLLVLNVEGLEKGMYHYLPMTHELELLKTYDPETDGGKALSSVCEQDFCLNGNVCFFYAAVPYRCEWRYAIDAMRLILLDAGHVSENLYIAATALGLGTCAIGAMDTPSADELFGLDGEEEMIFYAMPVGHIDSSNEEGEQAFYAFLKEE